MTIITSRLLRGSALAVLIGAVGGCTPDYSPNSYSSNAVQQANKVDQGVVVGVRPVDISGQSTVGAVTGAAGGGIVGSQVGDGITTAITTLGTSVIGGIVGSAVEKKATETNGFEYVVRKSNGELVSVTQKDDKPLPIGQHVLVIAGPQARIVADYTVPIDSDKPEPKPAAATPVAVPSPSLKPPPPVSAAVTDPSAANPAAVKPGDVKPGDVKPGDVKPGDVKPGDVKPVDAKPADDKPPAPDQPAAQDPVQIDVKSDLQPKAPSPPAEVVVPPPNLPASSDTDSSTGAEKPTAVPSERPSTGDGVTIEPLAAPTPIQ